MACTEIEWWSTHPDYLIERSDDGALTWTSLSDGVSTDRRYRATGLANGTTYRFRVAARNALGWSTYSDIAGRDASGLDKHHHRSHDVERHDGNDTDRCGVHDDVSVDHVARHDIACDHRVADHH